jgi:hypothetical protein
LEQILGGNSPHAENEFGVHQIDLARQPGRAGGRFGGFWIAVRRRAALQDIGDEDLWAAQADRFQHRIQELAGAANEWLALPIFFLPGRLTDDHPLRVVVANAEDGLGAASGQGTTLTTRDRGC